MELTFCGGDLRHGYAGAFLREQGHSITFWECQEQIKALCPESQSLAYTDTPKGDVLVLPSPLTRDGKTVEGTAGRLALTAVEKAVSRFAWVFVGMPSVPIRQKTAESGKSLVDLAEEENYTQTIAHITAEATLMLLFSHTQTTVDRLHIGILGYGRIGRSLAQKCLALGGKVTIFARGEEKPRQALRDGVTQVEGFPLSADALAPLSLLINTIPTPLLSPKEAEHLPKTAKLLELATGVQLPQNTCRPLILGHGLPGKLLPKATGEALATLILQKTSIPLH